MQCFILVSYCPPYLDRAGNPIEPMVSEGACHTYPEYLSEVDLRRESWNVKSPAATGRKAPNAQRKASASCQRWDVGRKPVMWQNG